MEHRKAELQEVGPCDSPGDDPARFLRELRRLRTGAGLGHAELAARAHYPYDVIRAAEAGPSLPSLPVLSAYVRGCGGAVTEWEERWRSLTRSPTLPLLPARPAGSSEAATAGARVGSVTPAADGHDPALIMAALDRVADGMAADSSSPSSSPSAAAVDSGMARAGIGSPGPVPAPSPDPALPGWAASVAGDSASVAGEPAPVATVPPPQAVFAAPATGQATSSRRLMPPRIAAAALAAVLLCLIVALLALFALSPGANVGSGPVRS